MASAESGSIPTWVTIEADEYQSVVNTRNILSGRNAVSHLANLIELEAANGAGTTRIRLDCSAEVGREVVACLRQGGSYSPPADPRLLRAVQQQVDYLGISAPTMPNSAALQGREVVLVPSYWYLGLNYDMNPHVDSLEPGLLMYSSGTRGWANMTGRQDPRWELPS